MAHAEGVGGQLADHPALVGRLAGHCAALGARWPPRRLDLAEHIEHAYGDPNLGGFFDHARDRPSAGSS